MARARRCAVGDAGPGDDGPTAARGYAVDHLCAPHPLRDTNGLSFGPGGALHIAHLFGNRVTAVDADTGSFRAIATHGHAIVAPDDVAFDADGLMYTTGPMTDEVCVRREGGAVGVLAGGLPAVNGIAVDGDTVFVDECRPGGRLLAIPRHGGAPIVMADNLPYPNAMALAPDGHLYFPCVVPGEIWRIPVSGGTAECVVAGLGRPTSVTLDGDADLVVTDAARGEVLRLDPRTRRTTVAAHLARGLDNCAVRADGRLYCSNYLDGSVHEVLATGAVRAVVPPGLIGPLGLAVRRDGSLVVADWWAVRAVGPDGRPVSIASRFEPGFPGLVRTVAVGPGDRLLVGTSGGEVAWLDLEPTRATVVVSGLDGLAGVAATPDGRVLAVEGRAGRVLEVAPGGAVRVLAAHLDDPVGIATDGAEAYVTEAGAHRVVGIGPAGVRTVTGAVDRPEGVALFGDSLLVVDAGTGTLLAIDLRSQDASRVVTCLPVGPSSGRRSGLPGIVGMMDGPLAPFAGLAVAADGTMFVSGDGDGSVVRVRPQIREGGPPCS